MYEYEDSQFEDIRALRSIIEVMINDNYLWTSADIAIVNNVLYEVKIKLLLSECAIPNTTDSLGKRVSFTFDDGRRSGFIYPLEEMGKDFFWSRLGVSDYLIKPRKNKGEHIYEIKNKTIGEAAKYLRQNVLIRNVKLFK